jgi:hypothetical protein
MMTITANTATLYFSARIMKHPYTPPYLVSAPVCGDCQKGSETASNARHCRPPCGRGGLGRARIVPSKDCLRLRLEMLIGRRPKRVPPPDIRFPLFYAGER